MTKRMNMRIEGRSYSAQDDKPVVVFRLEHALNAAIVLRAMTPQSDWHVLTINANGTLTRADGMGSPFQVDDDLRGHIRLSEPPHG